jgi:hypothetical protein
MKKEVLIVIVAIFAISLISAIDLPISSVTPLSGTELVITSLSYDPYPVSPGEHFELRVKIEPKGSSTLNNVTCEIKLSYPFSIYLDTPLRNYGKLAPGNIAVFKFTIKVDEGATQGDNELQLWCSESPSTGTWNIKKINITVQTRYPSLNIKEVNTEPALIAPGQEAKIKFRLENLADSYMKDINIKLDLSSVDIVPFGEISEKRLRLLAPKETSEIEFSIKPLPAAKGGIYKIPFSLIYTDNLGTPYNQTGIISIEVSSQTQLLTSIDSTTIYKSNSIGEVNIKLVNPGLTDIKYATIEVLPSRDFKLLTNNLIYIGDIDSDDSGTVTYKISVKTWSDKFEIPLKISYRDAINQEHLEYSNITFNILSNKEFGKEDSLIWIIFFSVVGILAILLIFIKSFREKVQTFYSNIQKRF